MLLDIIEHKETQQGKNVHSTLKVIALGDSKQSVTPNGHQILYMCNQSPMDFYFYLFYAPPHISFYQKRTQIQTVTSIYITYGRLSSHHKCRCYYLVAFLNRTPRFARRMVQ